MARKLVDISVPLQNDVPADPPGGHPTIQYIDHQQGLPRMLQFFDGLKAEDLPDGQGWAVEQVQLSTHNGTHLDAPWHFHPTMNRGERSWTIDEVPLEWCFQPGVKLDFRHFADGYVVTAADVEAELARIGHTLSPLEIVVVNTRAGSRYGHDDFVSAGRDIGYCHLEKLHNLEVLPADGFYISCFPHKIRGASAGWTRAVAIFDEALMASR